MIFSALLTATFSGLLIYALLQKAHFPIIARTLPFVCLTGIYIAWFPDQTSEVASWVGIGRGVDFVMYVWVVVSGLVFLVVHLKLVAQDRKLTELARVIALSGARAPLLPAGTSVRGGSAPERDESLA